MTDSFTTLVTAFKVLQAVYKIANWAYEKFAEKTPVKNAIAATAADFRNASGVESALIKLIESDEFSREVESAKAGETIDTNEGVANLLVEIGDFYTGINSSHRDALKVIETFLRYLQIEMLRSPDAHLFAEQRAEIRHRETIEAIHQSRRDSPPKFEVVDKKNMDLVRDAASELADNSLTARARRIWNERPQIDLQAVKMSQKDQENWETLSLESIQTLLTEGRRLLLEAPPGRGKTTTLVQIAKQVCSTGELAFLVNLPTWIDSDHTMLEFLGRRPEFQSRSIDATTIAKLSRAVRFSFLLNGWNEISKVNSGKADIRLRELEQSFPSAGIIVSTRTHHITPPLSDALRVRLLPLTRAQRAEYLRQSLASRADDLISRLDNNRTLDDLTRTPLILSEVTTIFKEGYPIPKTKMGVLREVMMLLEQSEEHRSQLQNEPLMGLAQNYLTELATKMTTRGETKMSEIAARAVINSVSNKLKDTEQIATPPEQVWILSTLCAHHILERLDSQPVTFSFAHQQFQEFYAAESLGLQLMELVKSDNPGRNREFAKRYVNEPSWEEPLRMVAEEIGIRSAESHVKSDEVTAGKVLVEMALSVDPIFAAGLSRLCGNLVWEQVRTAIGGRLRSWYESDDENYRQCAVAGMLASGSDEFSDIILPLLKSDDPQVRLGAYRAGAGFHLSSLGAGQLNLVRNWSEEARISFIAELTFNRWIPPEIVANFALADPSLRVKLAAIQELNWIGSNEEVLQLLETLDEKNFEEAVQKLEVESIPRSLHPRVLVVYRKLLNESKDVMSRIEILLRAAEVGETGIAGKLKQELTELEPGKVTSAGEFVIEAALKLVQWAEPDWVSNWVANQIVDASLWSKRWIALVTSIPEELKERMLERISSDDIQRTPDSGIIPVLSAAGDSALAEAVFARLCEVRRSISDTGYAQNEPKRAIARQLEDLFRAFPPDVAVTGLKKYFAKEHDVIELSAVIEVYGRLGNDSGNLRSQLRDELRQNLRWYLKNGVSFVLGQKDFRGEMKAYLAMALARIGEPEDMGDIQQLIRADIERVRNARAARARGELGAQARGGSNSYSNWHVRAVAMLDTVGAEAILLNVLNDPDYEIDAAAALLGLATLRDAGNQSLYNRDYSIIWKARDGYPLRQFDEELRKRYAAALQKRISALLIERESGDQPLWYDYRLTELAKLLAEMDGQASAELVLQVIDMAEQSNMFMRIGAIEALLFGGAKLPVKAARKILDSVIEYIRERYYDSQSNLLLTRCLCLLPFVDDPSIGIERIRQVLSESGLPSYDLREVVAALGYSRSQEAVPLLSELVGDDGSLPEQIAQEWVKALATLDGPEARQILLSFVDPSIDKFGIDVDVDGARGDFLASYIADLTRAEPQIKQRVLQLSDLRLPPDRRDLLSNVLVQLGTGEAMLANLNLIDDAAAAPIPFYIRGALEDLFLERKPYGEKGGTHTITSYSSKETSEIRARLFEMLLHDGNRRQSAFKLLGQIEVWRLEYGRPDNEPRHPAFDTGEVWPPDPNLERGHESTSGYSATLPEEVMDTKPQSNAQNDHREQDIQHRYDLFLSHASEDKDSIARPLYKALIAQGISVWFDEAVLELGDSLRRKIDEGLAKCRYGVVILSPRFLGKQWPQRELDGLVARETASGEKAILPIWHELDHLTLLRYSPPLADLLAGRSEEGIPALVEKIRQVLRK